MRSIRVSISAKEYTIERVRASLWQGGTYTLVPLKC